MNYVTVPSVAREKARRAKEDWIQRKTLQINMGMLTLIQMGQSEKLESCIQMPLRLVYDDRR